MFLSLIKFNFSNIRKANLSLRLTELSWLYQFKDLNLSMCV